MRLAPRFCFALSLFAIPLSAPGQDRTNSVTNGDLVVEASASSGAYTIRTTGTVVDVITAGVAAKINGAWLHSSHYPRHEVTKSALHDELDAGTRLTITNTGLPERPDLVTSLTLHSSPPFADIRVEVRNSTGKKISVQDIRVLDASGDSFLRLNGPDTADRVLSDSFSEDRPDMLIHDFSDAEKFMHRAVGSQLIYNRESRQSLFVGALSSDHWLTVLRLHLDPSKSKFSSYEVDCTGTTELDAENSLRDSPPEDRIELSRPVAPGDSLSSERVALSLGSDYHAQLESYGAAIRTLHSARVGAPTPIGWWSWTAYYFGLTQGAALTNAQWLSEHLKDLGYTFFHMDEGYQFARGEYTTPNAVTIPGGMQALESRIRALGLTPGIWTAPFEVSERSWVFENHKDWLVRNSAGQPIHIGFVTEHSDQLYALDATNPGAQDYLRRTYRTLTRDWGIRYIKLDFMEDSAVEGIRFRPNTTALEALRLGLEVIRQAVGQDVLLDKDGSPMLAPVGIVDVGRISCDTGHTFDDTRNSATGIAARYYMNRNYFIADPDAFNISNQTMAEKDRPLTLDEARASIALSAVSGGMFEIGDDLPTLGSEPQRLALVQNRDLLDMARIGRASTPLDLMSYDSADELPSIFFLRESSRQAILTVFNWTKSPRSHSLNLSDIGLNPEHTFSATDVLDPASTVSIEKGAVQIENQPAQSARMIKLIDQSVPPSAPDVTAEVPDSAALGAAVQFSAQVNPSGVSATAYQWDFGDGVTLFGPRVSHAYTEVADFTVHLTVDGIDGVPAVRVFSIKVKGKFQSSPDLKENRRYREPSDH